MLFLKWPIDWPLAHHWLPCGQKFRFARCGECFTPLFARHLANASCPRPLEYVWKPNQKSRENVEETDPSCFAMREILDSPKSIYRSTNHNMTQNSQSETLIEMFWQATVLISEAIWNVEQVNALMLFFLVGNNLSWKLVLYEVLRWVALHSFAASESISAQHRWLCQYWWVAWMRLTLQVLSQKSIVANNSFG